MGQLWSGGGIPLPPLYPKGVAEIALIAPDGNDLPEIMADGVTAYDYMAINGRVFTEHQREAFDADFGVGLVHALHSPTLPAATIKNRLQRSLAGDPGYVGVQSLEVALFGRSIYTINLELEAQDGGS